uniref:tRNA (guanine(37)-N1)-methyltransferase n=1 Tax=Sphenodon punctatus TaxID=8508 RepID=A0A8D0H005_SPHPU
MLWQLHKSAGLLKRKYSRTAALSTSLPAEWKLLPRYLPEVVQRHNFSTMPEILEDKYHLDLHTPNPEVRGMTTLDRAAFKKTVVVPVLRVNKETLNKLTRSLKHLLLKRPGLKRVVEDPNDEDSRLLMLDPRKISAEDSLGEAEQQILKQFNINPKISEYNLELTYDNFKLEEILGAVLPEGQEVTSGFSRVGHMAHVNLREHQLPYKHLIGQVIIDKNPGITSAVNKLNIIESTYRNFQMEVLAGEENMIAKVKEYNHVYEFDFSKVYWNPRLCTEHTRIIEFLKPGDVLFDVFAGVGPFAIPAAKKNCLVFANDLNPESYKWLQHNCKLNKVDKRIKLFNMDGRDFLRGPAKEELTKELSARERKSSLHIAMNLPALAIEFLDVFPHLLDGEPCSADLPTVHCYGFSKEDNPTQDIQERAEAFLGSSLKGRCSVHLVRNVAPNKEMMCISFQLPPNVLYQKHHTWDEGPEEPASKRLRPNKDTPEEEMSPRE